jgi:hypothetical protein
LIPVLGRLFTAPNKDNRQVDIVIAVTPRVIRTPSITPEDEIERPTGSIAVPTSGSLADLVLQEAIDEKLANDRRQNNVAQVQLPDRPVFEPTYVRTDAKAESTNVTEQNAPAATVDLRQTSDSTSVAIKPIDSANVRTLAVRPTADASEDGVLPKPVALPVEETLAPLVPKNSSTAEFQLLPGSFELKKGEKMKVAVLVKSATPFRSAVLGFRFDQSRLAVRAIEYGDVFGADHAARPVSPYMNQNGRTFVSLAAARPSAENTSGVLAIIEVEALADGLQQIEFERAVMNLLASDGKSFAISY